MRLRPARPRDRRYWGRGGAQNNYTAPSKKGMIERMGEILRAHGHRKPNPMPINGRNLTWLIHTCSDILAREAPNEEIRRKADLYDEMQAAVVAADTVTLTRREHDRLVERCEILDTVDRDAREKAIRRHKLRQKVRHG